MHDKHAGRTLYARWYNINAQSTHGDVWQVATTQNNIVGEFETKEIADHIVAIHNSWIGRQEVTNWDRLQGDT